jgi:hypothetical protein
MLVVKFALLFIEVSPDHRPAITNEREKAATTSFFVRLFKFLRD